MPFAGRRKWPRLPRQFTNQYNAEVYRLTTGKVIWLQLQGTDSSPYAFVAEVGTGRPVMIVGRFLKSRKPDIRIHSLEPASGSNSTGFGELVSKLINA